MNHEPFRRQPALTGMVVTMAPVNVAKLRSNALLGVGVDRLDYTKSIEERLLAVERLLERFEHFRGRLTFVQLAAPSRTVIDDTFVVNPYDLEEAMSTVGPDGCSSTPLASEDENASPVGSRTTSSTPTAATRLEGTGLR